MSGPRRSDWYRARVAFVAADRLVVLAERCFGRGRNAEQIRSFRVSLERARRELRTMRD